MRKMWLIVRRAVSLAQLLTLQHKTEAGIRPERALRRTAVWSELWPRDRGFSLILGLPYAALESKASCLPDRGTPHPVPTRRRTFSACLRNEKRPVLKLCGMVGFQVFAAATTLVVDLLSLPQPPNHAGLYREEQDLQLVLQAEMELRRFSLSMKGCKVAALGARVLKDFSSLQKASAEEICKIDITYFGKIEIQWRHTRHNKHVAYAYAATQTIDQLQNQHSPVGDAWACIEPAVSTGS
ncbi:hypothetical protein BDR22DRAFT_822939 [Usnea florida]